MQNSLRNQVFTIDLMPVDNEEPVVTNNGLQGKFNFDQTIVIVIFNIIWYFYSIKNKIYLFSCL